MILELMSRGNMARLPDTMPLDGMPEIPVPGVLLLLPYNRYLLGSLTAKNYEKWTVGKIGTGEAKEVFLYDGTPLVLSLGEMEQVVLSPEAAAQLRLFLQRQMPPPGEFLPGVLILRGLLKENALLSDEDMVHNEGAMIDALEKDPLMRAAYWAIRFALFRNDYEAVSRIKTWLKSAADVFENSGQQPRIWFSLTDLPGRKDTEEMASLAFSLDDLQRMNSQSSRPVVLYSKAGYLILSDFGSEGAETAFRVWLFLPVVLWNEMREKRKLSIREIVMAAWGCLDGMAAENERMKYGLRTRVSS